MSYNNPYNNPVRPSEVMRWVGVVFAIVALLVGLIVGMIAGIGAFSRAQNLAGARNAAHIARVHAANQTQVNQLLIAANAQNVQIHEQQAKIRQVDAEGIRAAQDEIAKTLTPLYVQFEMTQALEQIAQSGRNNTVVYIPSGAGGIPLVSTTDPLKVGQ